jgi:acyl carrier protein
MSNLQSELQEVFRQVFDDDRLVITAASSAADVEGWDSMAHINLIIAIEKKFAVRFSPAELAGLGGKGQNVGSIMKILEARSAAAGH